MDQVTASGTVASSTGGALNVATATPTGSVSVALPLDVQVSSAGTLELAHWYVAYVNGSEDSIGASGAWSKGTPASYSVQNTNSPAGLFTAFHLDNADKTLIYNNAATSNSAALWACITITIKAPTAGADIDGVHYTQAEIATLLDGQSVNIALARDNTTNTSTVVEPSQHSHGSNPLQPSRLQQEIVFKLQLASPKIPRSPPQAWGLRYT